MDSQTDRFNTTADEFARIKSCRLQSGKSENVLFFTRLAVTHWNRVSGLKLYISKQRQPITNHKFACNLKTSSRSLTANSHLGWSVGQCAGISRRTFSWVRISSAANLMLLVFNTVCNLTVYMYSTVLYNHNWSNQKRNWLCRGNVSFKPKKMGQFKRCVGRMNV